MPTTTFYASNPVNKLVCLAYQEWKADNGNTDLALTIKVLAGLTGRTWAATAKLILTGFRTFTEAPVATFRVTEALIA